MTAAAHELSHQLEHTAEAGLLSATVFNTVLWLVPAIVVGAMAYFLPRRFDGNDSTRCLGGQTSLSAFSERASF
jgi:hypothetical protein